MDKPFTSIKNAKDLSSKRVLLRASLNEALQKGVLVNDYRVQQALETIKFLKESKSKVIILAHIGREKSDTLQPVYEYLKKHVGLNFVDEIVGDKTTEAIENMKGGDVILLQNVRSHEGEVKNDVDFAKELSKLGDIYVNDAFAVSHRAHASIVGIPEHLQSYAGLLFEREFENLSLARAPEHPALFILGGAKFNTKQPLVENFLDIYDCVFVGGALSNDFYKAKGYNIGESPVSDAADIEHLLDDERITIPSDVTVVGGDGSTRVVSPDELLDDDVINDCGPQTLEKLEDLIGNAKSILWNGPLGDYQVGFGDSTEEVARMIAESDAHSIVGGGDTASMLHSLGFSDSFSFCSTAGGAMLEFLLKGTLPGIEALSNSSSQ